MNEFIDIFKNIRRHLMTGVSYMVPFVVAGGILLAVGVMITGQGAAPAEALSQKTSLT